MSGRVVHLELAYDDAGRARQFSSRACGWNLMPMPELDHTIVSTGPMSESGQPTEPGYVNGGLLSRSQAASAGPVLVVDVDDVDAALEQVEEAGGRTVVGRTPVGRPGFTAYRRDPEGNVIGLWRQPAADLLAVR